MNYSRRLRTKSSLNSSTFLSSNHKRKSDNKSKMMKKSGTISTSKWTKRDKKHKVSRKSSRERFPYSKLNTRMAWKSSRVNNRTLSSKKRHYWVNWRKANNSNSRWRPPETRWRSHMSRVSPRLRAKMRSISMSSRLRRRNRSKFRNKKKLNSINWRRFMRVMPKLWKSSKNSQNNKTNKPKSKLKISPSKGSSSNSKKLSWSSTSRRTETKSKNWPQISTCLRNSSKKRSS